MADTGTPLLIKRYASRRLYNTESSDYVTLEQIAAFIREGRDIQIVDLKSGDDLTRQYLLQIITEHESRGENVLPINLLTDLVRSYTDKAQTFVPDFLSQSFNALKAQQEQLMENFKSAIPDPLDAFGSMDDWQEKQREFLATMMSGWSGGGRAPDGEAEDAKAPEPQDDDSTNDLATIKKQLADLQAKLSDM